MALRKILTIPDSILRQKSLPVDKVNKEIKALMDDMLDTMYDAPGIGLAAIQIGIPKRIVVMDLSKDPEKKNPMYFVNPEITWKSDLKSTYEEGCLSIPNQFAKIERPEKIAPATKYGAKMVVCQPGTEDIAKSKETIE